MGMTDKDKFRIKKMLCRMEGDPEQIDMYLHELREYLDAEERIEWAWEVIGKVFEEDSIRQIENYGLRPIYKKSSDIDDEDDEEENDADSDEDSNEDDVDEEEDDSEDDTDKENENEDNEDSEDSDDNEEDSDEEVEDDSEENEDDEDSEDNENDEDSEDDEDDEDETSEDVDDEEEDDEEDEDDSNSDDEDEDDEEEASSVQEKVRVKEKPVVMPKFEEKKSSSNVSVKKKEKVVKKAVEMPPVAEEKKEVADIVAGVVLPTAQETDAIAMPTVEPVKIPETPLQGLQEAKIEKTSEGMMLRVSPEDAGKIHNGGVVYVLPADTGKEAELRVIQLRASTDENLDLVRKMHEEIARSVAEERQIRDSMYELVVAYQELAKQLTENAQQAGEIRQKLVEGTVRAERFVNEDMSRMLQQRAQEATNDFYQESKDHFNDLFKAAVRKYKQFTEAVMDFQNKIADDSSRRIRTIETKVSMVEKVCYGTIVLLMINIVISIFFKIFG